MSDDALTDLLVGVAELLDAQGAGDWSGLDGPAPTSALATAITLRQTPIAPDRSITLTDYAVSASARLTDTITGLNVRCRGDRSPSSASAVAGKVYLALQALGRATLGTAPNQVIVSDIYWQSEAQVGPDANGRSVRSVNYYVRWNRGHPRLD